MKMRWHPAAPSAPLCAHKIKEKTVPKLSAAGTVFWFHFFAELLRRREFYRSRKDTLHRDKPYRQKNADRRRRIFAFKTSQAGSFCIFARNGAAFFGKTRSNEAFAVRRDFRRQKPRAAGGSDLNQQYGIKAASAEGLNCGLRHGAKLTHPAFCLRFLRNCDIMAYRKRGESA